MINLNNNFRRLFFKQEIADDFEANGYDPRYTFKVIRLDTEGDEPSVSVLDKNNMTDTYEATGGSFTTQQLNEIKTIRNWDSSGSANSHNNDYLLDLSYSQFRMTDFSYKLSSDYKINSNHLKDITYSDAEYNIEIDLSNCSKNEIYKARKIYTDFYNNSNDYYQKTGVMSSINILGYKDNILDNPSYSTDLADWNLSATNLKQKVLWQNLSFEEGSDTLKIKIMLYAPKNIFYINQDNEYGDVANQMWTSVEFTHVDNSTRFSFPNIFINPVKYELEYIIKDFIEKEVSGKPNIISAKIDRGSTTPIDWYNTKNQPNKLFNFYISKTSKKVKPLKIFVDDSNVSRAISFPRSELFNNVGIKSDFRFFMNLQPTDTIVFSEQPSDLADKGIFIIIRMKPFIQ